MAGENLGPKIEAAIVDLTFQWSVKFLVAFVMSYLIYYMSA